VNKPLFKTAITIWTDYDPSMVETDVLTRGVYGGLAYAVRQATVQVDDPASDPDFPDTDFFGSVDDEEDLCCASCGQPMVVNGDGTTNHLVDGSEGVDEIDHDQDGDHVAYAPEED